MPEPRKVHPTEVDALPSVGHARPSAQEDNTSRSAQPSGGPPISRLRVCVCTIPTDRPESDGTLEWNSTTIVIVEPEAGGVRGLGYTYADPAAGHLIAETLSSRVIGLDAFDVPRAWQSLVTTMRNAGRPGIAATAISAVDNALWDLKARLLGVSLVDLLGRVRDSIPAYGSGGFTSYTDDELRQQLGSWADDGFAFVKMKVGRDPDADPHRVDVARQAVGDRVALFVDANGAHDRKGALAAADRFAERDVRWFEEPVSSDDLAGLRLVRDRGPAGMQIAAGEYAWDPFAFRALLDAGAVDTLQADATRCLGISGFLVAAALCEAQNVPLSAHCAPTLHVPLMCSARRGVHLEWFHDHVRIERLLFEGAPQPIAGRTEPDRSRPGLGIEFRRADAEPYLQWSTP